MQVRAGPMAGAKVDERLDRMKSEQPDQIKLQVLKTERRNDYPAMVRRPRAGAARES